MCSDTCRTYLYAVHHEYAHLTDSEGQASGALRHTPYRYAVQPLTEHSAWFRGWNGAERCSQTVSALPPCPQGDAMTLAAAHPQTHTHTHPPLPTCSCCW